jgi:hypothetical protein
VCHLLELAGRYPLSHFEAQMMTFLESLQQQIPDPVLEQLNQGPLDGFTVSQTQSMINRARVVL